MRGVIGRSESGKDVGSAEVEMGKSESGTNVGRNEIGYILEGTSRDSIEGSEGEYIGRGGAWEFRKERGMIWGKERGTVTEMRLGCGQAGLDVDERAAAVQIPPDLSVMGNVLLCTLVGTGY